ncbi:MAG: FHA domain-containing protein [Archangium sp.]|nr:FHA domain-containing protein [Archangium sp.]
MSVRLTVTMRGGEAGGEKPKIVVLDGDTITFGREATCDVQLAQQAVSRNHARISRDDTLFFLEDLGSAYGTNVNGTKLPKGEKRLLRNGDTIGIAQFDIIFDRVVEADEGEDRTGKTSFLARKVVKDVMKGLSAGGDLPYLRIMNGPREGQRFDIGDAQEYFVGRDETADIQLHDDLVSRRHVKIRRDWSGTHVEDLGSRNGIRVNKKREARVTLKDRDEVQIGNTKLLFIDPSEVRDAPLLASARDDEAEGTLSVKASGLAPVTASPDEGSADSDADGDGAASEDEGSDDDAAADDSSADASGGDEASSGGDESDAGNDADDGDEGEQSRIDTRDDEPAEGLGRFIDVSNKKSLAALGAIALLIIAGLVILGLLLAGA